MDELEKHTIRLQEEFDARGPQNAAVLKPQIDHLMKTMRRQGLPVPRSLRRMDTALRLEAEDDFFDNMPV